jgi:RNA polymerase sigma factor (sigma-70 family)
MDAEYIQTRLSQISTAWTLIARAHSGGVAPEATAQAALVERYQTAVYRYLLAAVRDLDIADELFQEFALRMVRGDFGRADPQRGRFRDYVKSSLINLVIDFHRKQKKQFAPAPLEEPAAPAPDGFDSDEAFLANWRTILLDRAWDALAAIQTSGGPPFLTVLRFRTAHPELSNLQMLEQLNALLQPTPPFTDAGLRKILQRARDKFTDLVVEEVARSLQTDAMDAIEQELIDLGFQAYCKRALQRRQSQGKA